jgi:hypothetical protein
MYGLNIYKPNHSLAYSTTDVTWNQVDFFYVAGGGSASHVYPTIAGREVLTTQVLVNSPPTNRRAYAHNVTVSGTTVSASGGSENAYILVLMR